MKTQRLPFCCLPLEYYSIQYHTQNDSAPLPRHVFKLCELEHYGLADLTRFRDDNDSSAAPHDTQRQHDLWFSVGLGVICLFGFVANCLNLVVLANRRITSRLDCIGKSVNNGLMALALSDLLFCVVAFPHCFMTIKEYELLMKREDIMGIYYKMYGVALINLFQMSSMWLVVVLAVARYFGVADPLHARSHVCTTHMPCALAIVYLFSILTTLPMFLDFKVKSCQGYDSILYYRQTVFQSEHASLSIGYYIKRVFPVIANFLPVFILIVFNLLLVKQLHNQKGKRLRRYTSTESRKCGGNRIVTITLIGIVAMSILLVAPPEILRYVNPFAKWGRTGVIIAKVANLLQALNFALNFVLYCFVNAHFRKTIQSLLVQVLRWSQRKLGLNQLELPQRNSLEPKSSAMLKTIEEFELLSAKHQHSVTPSGKDDDVDDDDEERDHCCHQDTQYE